MASSRANMLAGPPGAWYRLRDDEAIRIAGKDALEGSERHVTGQEVLAGMRELALERFGPLAAQVWRSWGIESTLDWGRIVFLLVEAKMLNRQDEDTIEDFSAGFDFEQAFVQDYRPELPDDSDDFLSESEPA